MKKLGLGIFVGLILLMTGCLDDDDGYSLDKMWVGFGVIQAPDSTSVEIIMDNGDVLVPVAWDRYHDRDGNVYQDVQNHLENGDRVMVNYTILDDDANEQGEIGIYYVKVNSIKSILMKGVIDITPENADSIGNDPIIVQDYWMTDSLLTYKLKYWGNNQVHFLNLVKAPGEITADSQPIALELRHNANGDDESIPYTAFVSFSLNDLRIEGLESVEFVVTSTDYDGVEHTEEGDFDYSDLN
jgi:hypothetical protein